MVEREGEKGRERKTYRVVGVEGLEQLLQAVRRSRTEALQRLHETPEGGRPTAVADGHRHGRRTRGLVPFYRRRGLGCFARVVLGSSCSDAAGG
jgi:hypothetical protein